MWVWMISFFPLVTGQLDLSSIKRQQTYAPASTGTTPPTSTVGPCNVGCQEGWVPYAGNCFKKSENSYEPNRTMRLQKMSDVLTQASAEQECVQLGAHLASFLTSAEASAVKSLVLEAPLFTDDLISFVTSSQESWIGLMKETDGAWAWTDSSPVDFTNLPDGTSASGSSCVSMNVNGTWQPSSCSATASSFICKRTSASS